MAESPTFEWCSAALEERTGLDRLAARGTVRLALRKSGLASHSVGPAEMSAVLRKVMPKELLHRGVEESDELCRRLVSDLKEVRLESIRTTRERPEDVFRRFFGEGSEEGSS